MPGTTVNQVNIGLTGTTGTGSFVGSTNASITSATLSGSYALGTPGSGNLSNCTNAIWGGSYNSVPVTLLTASGTVTANQLKALHATPAPLIAAQGANTIILLISIWGYYVYGTTPYTAAASQVVRLSYGTTQAIQASFFTNSVLTGSVSAITQEPLISLASIATANFVNVAVNFYNPIATEITTGDSTINWGAQYIVLTTP